MSRQGGGLHEADTRSAEEELQRRRERGKLSQARFRKKQAQAVQEMREENEKLKLAIAHIVRATKQSDRHSLPEAIRKAAKIAGLEVEAASMSEESCKGSFPDSPANRQNGLAVTQRWGLSADASSCAALSSLGSRPAVSERQVHSRAWDPRSIAMTLKSGSHAGGLSPRLDYGIWIDASSAVRICEPSPSVVPFLGNGRYKFAGQVFWACTDYLISLCRVATTPRSPCEWFDNANGHRPTAKEAEDRVWSIIQHTPPIGNVRLALTLAEAQLEFRDNGYIHGDSPVSDTETATLLQRDLEAQYEAIGKDMSVWMNAMELERHVRQKLGDEAFGRLEKAIAAYNTSVPEGIGEESLVSPEAFMVVRLLVKNLAESYVCFGDGPRWRVDSVSALFNENIIT